MTIYLDWLKLELPQLFPNEPTRWPTRSKRTPSRRNPAGAKLIRQLYRKKHGVKGTFEEALKWYAALK